MSPEEPPADFPPQVPLPAQSVSLTPDAMKEKVAEREEEIDNYINK
jgi:hypothetical protein